MVLGEDLCLQRQYCRRELNLSSLEESTDRVVLWFGNTTFVVLGLVVPTAVTAMFWWWAGHATSESGRSTEKASSRPVGRDSPGQDSLLPHVWWPRQQLRG